MTSKFAQAMNNIIWFIFVTSLPLFRFICPIEGIGMIIWWIVDEIRLNADPYKEYPFWVFTTTSLITILTEVRLMYTNSYFSIKEKNLWLITEGVWPLKKSCSKFSVGNETKPWFTLWCHCQHSITSVWGDAGIDLIFIPVLCHKH